MLQDMLLAGAGATQLLSDTVPLLECMHCTSLVLTPPVNIGMSDAELACTVQIRNAVGEMLKHAVHLWVLQAACLPVQPLKGGRTMQRIGVATSLSTDASRDMVRTVHMVAIADCKALLSPCSRRHLGHIYSAHSHALCSSLRLSGLVFALRYCDLNCVFVCCSGFVPQGRVT